MPLFDLCELAFMSQHNRLESVESLARRMGLPSRTIEREVLRSRLPYVSIAGNWRFRERDIEAWIERVGPLPRLTPLVGGRGSRQPAIQAPWQLDGAEQRVPSRD